MVKEDSTAPSDDHFETRAGVRRHTYTARACPVSTVIEAAETDFAARFGATPREISGCLPTDLLRTSEAELLPRRFTELREGRTSSFTEQVTGQHGSGKTFTAALTATVVAGPTESTGPVLRLRLSKGEDSPDRAVLTELDARILEGVAAGLSTGQLAERLRLSRQGVNYHVRQLLRRYNAANHPALVARAHTLGLFAAGQWPPHVLPQLLK
ncbi:LuxR C-terminal-related transcriptional regulator [Streptomyces flavofungini]|uniref:LuxR C-terminal-related transcriptional regulator n=1 Tax=Streptomyces flavofungini TaxID=68200 RepID=UPI0034E02202